MPEGGTIYRAAQALQKAIGGKVVTGFETGLAKPARVNDEAALVGRTWLRDRQRQQRNTGVSPLRFASVEMTYVCG